MAEQASTQVIAPSPNGGGGEYQIQIKEFSGSGASTSFSVPIPFNIDSHTASVMLRAAILKKTTWKLFEFPTILHAVVYADRMGLDIMAGDVYQAEEGRLSTTAGAKIRHAMASGKIEGYDVEITPGPAIEIPWTTQKQSGTYTGTNLHAKVSVYVRGWRGPVVYETDLSEWFVGRNPNWRTRPGYMLRRNALSKALEEVAPMGVEADEAPPLTETILTPASNGTMIHSPAPVNTPPRFVDRIPEHPENVTK